VILGFDFFFLIGETEREWKKKEKKKKKTEREREEKKGREQNVLLGLFGFCLFITMTFHCMF
jgi:uncharacterized membrane protein